MRPFHSIPALGILLLALATIAPFPGAAQALPPQLAAWDVQVWPEYDDPAVLVIATGTLSEETPLPQTVSIPIPAGSRVHAVAYPDATGNLLTLPWRADPGASGQDVIFDLNQPRFVVEYYADILSPPPNRRFDLNLVAPYLVQQASLTLRQPSRASNFQVTPAMAAGVLDGLGNPTYTLELGPLQAAQSVSVQVSYTKADAEPSVTGLAVVDTPAVASGSEPGWLTLLIGAVVGLLIGVGVVYLVWRRRERGSSRQARRRDARKKGREPMRSPVAGSPPAAVSNKFCVQCGQKFEGNDRFCRKCGAQRR